MAYGIYSEDFLAICLYMVKGDISAPLSQLIDVVESFQKEKDSYYGTIDSDFRILLLYICLEQHYIEKFPSNIDDFLIFQDIQVKEIILPVLEKHYGYFTDGDVCWVSFGKGSRRLKAYDEMCRFFSSGVDKKSEEILRFLEHSSWSSAITEQCLEKGDYQDTTWGTDIDWDDFLTAFK